MAEKINFEDGINELEGIVSRLESGEMPLDESFKAFERGAELAKELKKLLDDGDRRIRELTESGEKELEKE